MLINVSLSDLKVRGPKMKVECYVIVLVAVHSCEHMWLAHIPYTGNTLDWSSIISRAHSRRLLIIFVLSLLPGPAGVGEQPHLREGESTWKGIVQILFLINEMFPGCTVANVIFQKILGWGKI